MSTRYATTQAFGGRRARLGDTVLLRHHKTGSLVAIDIYKIVDHDLAMTQVIYEDESLFAIELGAEGSPSEPWYTYTDARTPDDLDRMQPGQWCWPPEV